MGISDDTEDATITIDEATILEIKAMIALPFQSVLHVQSFFSLIFSFPSSLWSHRRSSLVALHHAKHAIIDTRRFRLKNQRFDGKRATESTSVGTHTEAQMSVLFFALSLNLLERMASQ